MELTQPINKGDKFIRLCDAVHITETGKKPTFKEEKREYIGSVTSIDPLAPVVYCENGFVHLIKNIDIIERAKY